MVRKAIAVVAVLTVSAASALVRLSREDRTWLRYVGEDDFEHDDPIDHEDWSL